MFVRRSAGVARLAPLVVVLALVTACGASSPKHVSTTSSPPPPSPVGAAKGTPVTMSIGPSGGSLSASDGGITVDIPAGALASAVTIGVQPIENTAAGGLGEAFRLTPTGQTFAKPVRVSFPYTDADAAGTVPEALGIAFQDAQGLWEWQTAAVDQTAKRLSVMTSHFTDWSKLRGVQIQPPDATLRVNRQISLSVVVCLQKDGRRTLVRYKCAPLAVGSGDLEQLVRIDPDTWSVNNRRGGTSAIGTVKGNGNSAVYTAPAKRPATSGGKAIVAVSVEVVVNGAEKILVSNITITGGYHVVGMFRQEFSNLVCGGTFSKLVTDNFSLDVTPGEGDLLRVTLIKNSKTVFAKPAAPVGVQTTLISPPDVFFGQKGTAEIGDGVITVSVEGTSTVGSCRIGPLTTPSATEDYQTGVAFHTDQFSDDGIQRNLDADLGDDVTGSWKYTVTEI